MDHQYQMTTEKFTKVKAVEMMEGQGARVKRVFPSAGMRSFDPFVLMDEFFVEPPHGFPNHPHKGFEAITYMIDGGFHHRDSMGNDDVVNAGGVQRFTAGKGMEHTESPVERGVNHGIQLWINLPEDKKKVDPSYQKLESKDLQVEETDARIETNIVGPGSPLKLYTQIYFKDFLLRADNSLLLDTTKEYRGFIYLLSDINGSLIVNDDRLEPGEAYFFENADAIKVDSKEQDVRFIFVSGIPLDQEIVIRGTYVE